MKTAGLLDYLHAVENLVAFLVIMFEPKAQQQQIMQKYLMQENIHSNIVFLKFIKRTVLSLEAKFQAYF